MRTTTFQFSEYQTPDSQWVASPLFTETPFFSLKCVSLHPLLTNRLWYSSYWRKGKSRLGLKHHAVSAGRITRGFPNLRLAKHRLASGAQGTSPSNRLERGGPTHESLTEVDSTAFFPVFLQLRLVFAPLGPSLRYPQWQHSLEGREPPLTLRQENHYLYFGHFSPVRQGRFPCGTALFLQSRSCTTGFWVCTTGWRPRLHLCTPSPALRLRVVGYLVNSGPCH